MMVSSNNFLRIHISGILQAIFLFMIRYLQFDGARIILIIRKTNLLVMELMLNNFLKEAKWNRFFFLLNLWYKVEKY